MQFKRKHLQMAAMGIGLAFIVFGAVQGILGFQVSKKVSDGAFFVAAIAVAGLLIYGRKLPNSGDKQNTEIEQADDVQQIDSEPDKENKDTPEN